MKLLPQILYNAPFAFGIGLLFLSNMAFAFQANVEKPFDSVVLNSQNDLVCDSILYVDVNNATPGNGTSWTDAFDDLQDALAAAHLCSSITEIWVAAGTYYPTDGTDRSISFTISRDSIRIYGGFDGTETSKDQRDWLSNETILSGNIGNPSDSTDNSYHVVFINAATVDSITAQTLIDGFTITEGVANGNTTAETSGGGIYCDASNNGICSPLLKNLLFENNAAGSGGAISIISIGGECSPSIINTTFNKNAASNGADPLNSQFGNGGAMYSSSSEGGICNPLIINANFINNTAYRDGGAIHSRSYASSICNPSIINATFNNNTANLDGEAIYNINWSGGICSPIISNSIFWGNVAGASGNQIDNANSATCTLSNSIIKGSGSSTNWDSALGTDGGNNLDTDPLFINADVPAGADNIFGTADDGLFPTSSSPAINAGDNTAWSNTGLMEDITGEMRPSDNTVDIGAYEYNFSNTLDPADSILYVNVNNATPVDGATWADAFDDLQDALAAAHLYSSIHEIWVAAGTYYPTDSTDRSISFTISRDSIRIYGGFEGTETSKDQRDWLSNETILSGNIGNSSDSTDNSYHVVFIDGTTGDSITEQTVLDGFWIVYGVANGTTGNNINGGGIYCDGAFSGNACSPRISNVCITENSSAGNGGGMYLNGSFEGSTKPELTNIIFTDNSAKFGGGAISNFGSYNGNSSPRISNAIFNNNSASFGGAINIDGQFGKSEPIITNATIINNNAVSGGGLFGKGLFGDCKPLISNSIIWDNDTSSNNSIIYMDDASPSFSYNLIKNSYASAQWDSLIGLDSGNNLDLNPLFIDVQDPIGDDNIWTTADDGLQLTAASPAINTGDSTAWTNTGLSMDIAGNTRPFDGKIDIGAFEFNQCELSSPTANCKDVRIHLNDSGISLIDSSYIDDNSLFNCTPIRTINLSQDSFSCADLGTNTINMIVTDGLGLSDTCQAVVTVVDTISPTDSCLQSYQVDITAEGTKVTAAGLATAATDNCGSDALSFSFAADSILADKTFFCTDFQAEPMPITVYIQDSSGNATSCMTNLNFTVAAAACDCSGDTLILIDTTSGSNYSAAQHIQSSAKVMANDTVLFTAGQSILLTAGFHSKYGSVFNARIDSCSAAASFAGDLAQVHQLEEENNSMPGISTNTSRVVSYPNPFSLYNKIKLNLEEAGVVRIYLQDIKGRKLLPVFKDEMLSAGNHEFMLDGTKLSAGVYFVIVQTAKWTEVLRLVRIND